MAIVFMPAVLHRSIHSVEGTPKINEMIGGLARIRASSCDSKSGLNIPSLGYVGGERPYDSYLELNLSMNC